MIEIYKKLPEELKNLVDYYVKKNIKSYVVSDLLIEVQQKRKSNIKSYINMIKKDLLYCFYYWIIIPEKCIPSWELGYNDRDKYKLFFKKLFPEITDISTINRIYKYYLSITDSNNTEKDFINHCIDNLSIEEAEDLYNYTLFIFYLTKINYSPLTTSYKFNTKI